MNSNSKICTFAHVTSVYFATSKVIKEAEILQEGFSLILGSSDIWSDAAIVQCIFVGANSNIQLFSGFLLFRTPSLQMSDEPNISISRISALSF